MSEDKTGFSAEDSASQRLSGDEFCAIVERAIANDRDALSDLCEMVGKSVLFRMSYLIGNEIEAEDLTQEVMIRVIHGISKLRSPRAFGSWLSSIIANEANTYLSKKSKITATENIDDYVDVVEEKSAESLPHDNAENVSRREVIMNILSTLPERQRMAITLHYYDNLSISETAEVMGITKQSVSGYLEIAHGKLKDEIEQIKYGGLSALLAGVPVGVIISDTLYASEVTFSPAQEIILQIVACSLEVIAENAVVAEAATVTTTGAVAGGISKGLIAGITTAVAAVFAIVFGFMFLGNPSTNEQTDTEIFYTFQAPSDAVGVVYFTGNLTGNNEHPNHVNPISAVPVPESRFGELMSLNWWITMPGTDVVLHEGYGDSVDGVFNIMFENGETGMFMLFFNLQAENGINYELSSNFYIWHG